MKISYLHIRNYKQFSNLELDLTYPKGHEKAGEPLDKICIIGQSGTGKTNLLEIINNTELNYCGEMKYPYTDKTRIITKFKMKQKHYINFEFIQKKFKDIQFKKLENEKCYLTKASKELNNLIWKRLEKDIEQYNIQRLEYTDKLSNKLLNIDNYTKKDFKIDMEEWKEKNNNILEQISDKLNKFLIKFNIELTIVDENQKSYNDLIFKDLSNGNIIEYDDLSTGTKNIIATFVPLKINNPKNSIILIDEPEMSFYPDIQRELVDLYTTVGTNNQLVMATHSPLIASSFEPWEVVELKFDKNNQIYIEKYFEGEVNHVDNYVVDPRMLTWTGILTDVFDLKEDAFSLREQKLMEYGMLKAEIKAMEKGKDRDDKLQKFKKLSSLLGLQN